MGCPVAVSTSGGIGVGPGIRRFTLLLLKYTLIVTSYALYTFGQQK